MARHSAKTTRTTAVAAQKRPALERWGSRFCAGYEVTVKIDPTQTTSLGRVGRTRGTGERE
jgi:hypothetical protein